MRVRCYPSSIVTSLLTVCAVAGPAFAQPAAPPIRVLPLQRRAAGSGTALRAGAPDARLAALAQRLRNRLGARIPSSGGFTARQATALAALQQRAAGGIEVHLRPGVGTPSLVRGAVLQRARAGGAEADPDERTARAFLRAQRALLRLDDPDDELVLQRSDGDELGRRHLRFAQQQNGRPVWPAELIVHLDAHGDVDALDGAFVPTPRFLAGAPALGADQAVAAARAAVPDGNAADAGGPELIVYAPGEHPPRLAWKLTLSAGPAVRWLVVIDALSGAALTAFNEVPEVNVQGSGIGLHGETLPLNVWSEDGAFYLVDTSKPMYDPTSDPPDFDTTRGGIVILDAQNQPPIANPVDVPTLFQISTDNPTGWAPADGVSAAFALSEVYDYYNERHARNSIDGAGGSILGIVRLGRNYANAFWSGSYMAFGDADTYADSIDAVAHELTHGVTQYTANLVYHDQPGALNEALSDIFGESVESFATGSNDWVIGSGIRQPIRDMAHPERFGDPSTFGDFRVTNDDHGGVHSNSGIINHAYYLLADGLDGAIGIHDAERIFYRALAFHLVNNSQFIDARLACVASAGELFGPDSIQARQTAAAFDAVEIFDGRSTPPPTPFPGVEGDDATLFLFIDANQGGYFLARRERALQDGDNGIRLIDFSVGSARPAVSGDGSFAAFVSTDHDACFTTTDGSPIGSGDPSPTMCLGFPGLVSSVAMAPDGKRFGFVLLDASGAPDNAIRVIDLRDGASATTYPLVAPAMDGGGFDTILFADAMDFTADGTALVYDALNQLQLTDGSNAQAWSIFALDLATGETRAVVPPVPGLDIAFPALSQRRDNFVVFDVYDSTAGHSTVTTANLTNGDMAAVATVDGYGVPGYTGDDTAIVYSQNSDTPTGFSLWRQALADDRLTPQGSPALWLAEGDFSVIYRRGPFVGPGACAGDCDGGGTVTIDELIKGVSIALGSQPASTCTSFDSNGDGQVSIAELVAAVNSALGGC